MGRRISIRRDRKPPGFARLAAVGVAIGVTLSAGPAAAQLNPALAENAIVVDQDPAGLVRIPSWQRVIDAIGAVSLDEFDVDEQRTGTRIAGRFDRRLSIALQMSLVRGRRPD